jgi:hypothetical protein
LNSDERGAVDRAGIAHHSVISEFDVPSYRTAPAQQQAKKPGSKKQAADTKNNRK